MTEQADPKDDPVFILHRYYLQASVLRRLFEDMLKKYPGPHTAFTEGLLNLQTSMGLWYGAVYAVAEGVARQREAHRCHS